MIGYLADQRGQRPRSQPCHTHLSSARPSATACGKPTVYLTPVAAPSVTYPWCAACRRAELDAHGREA